MGGAVGRGVGSDHLLPLTSPIDLTHPGDRIAQFVPVRFGDQSQAMDERGDAATGEHAALGHTAEILALAGS